MLQRFFIFLFIFFPFSFLFADDLEYRLSTILLKTHKGEYRFLVEIAETPEQLSAGLMNREELEEESGMLFIQPKSEIMSIWMKNVLFPVDLLFIDKKGKIVALHPNMVPNSTVPINSGEKVKAALELPAGSIERFEIALGDRVIHEKFS